MVRPAAFHCETLLEEKPVVIFCCTADALRITWVHKNIKSTEIQYVKPLCKRLFSGIIALLVRRAGRGMAQRCRISCVFT